MIVGGRPGKSLLCRSQMKYFSENIGCLRELTIKTGDRMEEVAVKAVLTVVTIMFL